MRRSNVYNLRRPADLSFNATPMIDCAMQLIIFFMLAGSFGSMDNVALKAPRPVESVAVDLKLQNKAVINILPYDEPAIEADPGLAGQARCYRMGNREFAPVDRDGLAAELQNAMTGFETHKQADSKMKNMAFQVEIRADRTIDYRDVEPVMMAVAKVGIVRMNITAIEQSGGL